MRLLLCLAGDTGTPLELELDLADDVTVGELADHLAARCGQPPGATLGARFGNGREERLDRGHAVCDAGPRSGSTVRLTAPGPSQRPPSPSPVTLVAPDSPPLRLPYGSTMLDGARLDVDTRVTLRSCGPDAPSVNGERVLGHARLAAGDLVWTGRRGVEVRLDGPLRPPPEAGAFELVHRTPERRVHHRPRKVELPSPPPSVRRPGFPVLSAAVPLLMGAGLWAVTRSAASAAFVLFSFVFVVASGIEARRESAAEERFRVGEFRAECAARVAELRGLRSSERECLERDAPCADEVLAAVAGRTGRLWERRHRSPGALRVRLGEASVPAADVAVLPTTGRRDLLDELRSTADELRRSRLPITVDLLETGGLAVVGPDERPTAIARALVAQLVGLLGPDALALRVAASGERAKEWSWCGWLPHSGPGGAGQHVLVVVDGDRDGDDRVAAALDASSAATPLWLASSAAGLPPTVRAVLELTAHGDVLTVTDEHGAVVRRVGGLDVQQLSTDEATALARSLAPLVPAPMPGESGGSAVASSVLLSEVTGSRDPEDVRARWERAAAGGTLGAPLGHTDGGMLSLDLREDGPHALVAGTTGAGKSELLRTLVASLALHHGPDRLTFLLVDYKGGAAFGSLDALPHTVGVITDLDDGLAARALRSLRAELRRREEVLARHGVAEVAELDGRTAEPPLASLVVVVDEFATLARDLPEFVDGLVDIAQRGRSLGIHLVLATQRPAGVVTDSIRANAALRIALRVADEDDSLDVVDVPDAAHLPRELPGRAVVRVGPGRVAVAQVAWSGGPQRQVERVRSRRLGDAVEVGSARPEGGPSELEAAVVAACEAARLAGHAPPVRPWTDPLPAFVDLRSLPAAAAPGRAPIGWVDLPEQQRWELLEADLDRDGGVLVLGGPGSGASTALRTLVASLGSGPESLRAHVICAGAGLADLGAHPCVGDVVPIDDVERVLRLLRATEAELGRRMAGASDDPTVAGTGAVRRLLVIDGYGPFEEQYERLNRGEAVDLVSRIVRDGRRVGVHVAISARRRAEVPPGLVASLGFRVQLRCASVDEAALAGLPDAAAGADVPPGRGHVGTAEVQVAAPPDPAELRAAGAGASDAIAPERVPTLPRHVPLPTVQRCGAPDVWAVPVGLDADALAPVHLDLRHHHAVVAGPPRSGVTTALGTLAAGFDAAHLMTALRTPAGDEADADRGWASSSAWSEDAWAALLERAERDAGRGLRVLIAIDGFPELAEQAGAPVLEHDLLRVVAAGAASSVRIAIGGEADAMVRCYSDVLTRIRSGRTGLLLQPDPDVHPAIFRTSLPARDELPSCPGRGWALGPGTATPLQVAVR